MEPVKFAVVGIGGFGRSHLESVAEVEKMGLGRLDATVVIDPENHPAKLQEFQQRGVRVFNTLDDLLDAGGIDFITLPIGIHHHVPLSVACLEAGFNVYCEKPMTTVIQEADRLIETKNRTGKIAIIGYQHLYSRAIQTVKTRLLEGRLGDLKSVRLEAGWPRPDTYYARNTWAGQLKLGDTWVLDSPINNALAHYVNNAFYVCGPSLNESAVPVAVRAELYHARDIESLDTACLRATANSGVGITITFSHVSRENFGPFMVLNCEKGTVSWSTKETTIAYTDGTKETLDEGAPRLRTLPFVNAVESLRGQAEVISTPEIARSQTLCINGAHESCPNIQSIPSEVSERVDRSGSTFTVVQGMDDLIHRSGETGALFSELGVEWATPTTPFNLSGYTHFPATS